MERTRISATTRARMEARGLEFPLPAGRLPVIMEDDIMHTVDYPVCDDEECICYPLEREQIMAETAPRRRRRRQSLLESSYSDNASMPGNGGFNLMR